MSKALVDRKLMTLDERAEITSDTADGTDRIVVGHFAGKPQQFECVVHGVTVTRAALVGSST